MWVTKHKPTFSEQWIIILLNHNISLGNNEYTPYTILSSSDRLSVQLLQKLQFVFGIFFVFGSFSFYIPDYCSLVSDMASKHYKIAINMAFGTYTYVYRSLGLLHPTVSTDRYTNFTFILRSIEMYRENK